MAKHEVDRGEHMLMEPLNDSTGFYIKATKQLGEWQTRYQKMAIYETPHYGKLFRLDGFNMTSEREEFVYHENLIHPALTAHAAPKKVLIIGGGDGGSSEEALKHPSVEQVTMVEIDGDVIEVAKEHFKAVHNGVFDNPKLRVRGRRRHEVRARDAGEVRPDRARPERPDGAGRGAVLGRVLPAAARGAGRAARWCCTSARRWRGRSASPSWPSA